MIRINDINYRNLEEQVQKNKEDIAKHYASDRVLADFGIRVVGRVSTENQLPDPITYTGNFGDAYYVGNVEPFTFWIYTRADYAGGFPNNYWLDIGTLTIQGPIGPTGQIGPVGPQGIRGSRWFSGQGVPSSGSDNITGDMYLNTSNGDVYRYDEAYSKVGNIRGPQGIQGIRGERGEQGLIGPVGPVGPQGPQGESIEFVGTLNNINELPNPSTVARNSAYLITNEDGAYDIYVIVGNGTLDWVNVGSFGGSSGSEVLINGQVVDQFNADTKVDKITGTPDSGATRGFIYGLDSDGTTPKLYRVQIQANTSGTIPVRDSSYNFYIGTPTQQYHCTPKSYVDNAVDNKVTKTTTVSQVYGTDVSSNQTTYNISSSLLGNSIPLRNTSGQIEVATPSTNAHATTKSYVDTQVGNSLTSARNYTNEQIAAIPKVTNNNQLTNGAGYITASSLPTKTSQLTNDSDYVTSSEVPTYTAGSGISISSSGVISNTRSSGVTKYAHNITFESTSTASKKFYVSLVLINTSSAKIETVSALRAALSNFSLYPLPASGTADGYPMFGVRQGGTSSEPAIELRYIQSSYGEKTLSVKEADIYLGNINDIVT